uniref:DEP domain containing 1a n=1 Tax=Salmo trutta TaxID=8032 RepID=A0A673ZJB0_SALTR
MHTAIYIFHLQWNEVAKLFRAGMPLRKHRQHFRVYGNCFTAVAAVDWLHELLRKNSNFGPDVTRQQTVQLLKKFLKNHVIEDVKGRWGSEDLEDNFPAAMFQHLVESLPRRVEAFYSSKGGTNSILMPMIFGMRCSTSRCPHTFDDYYFSQENVDPSKQDMETEPVIEVVQPRVLTEEYIQDVWRGITLTHLQKTLGLTSLEDVLDPRHVNPQNIVYNMTNVNKHGVVTLEDKTDDLPHWVLSAMKGLANWPKYDASQPSYPGFERDVFKTVSDYFYCLPRPLLTSEYYKLFVNILGLLQPQLEQVAIEALQLCTLLLMISRMSQNVDLPRLHDAIMAYMFSHCVLGCKEEMDLDELLATRLISFLMDHHQEILQVPVYLQNAVQDHIAYLRKVQITYPGSVGAPMPVHSFCRRISTKEFEEQKLSLSQAAIADLLESLVKDENMSMKDRKKKLKQFQRQYPDIYSCHFPTTESEPPLLISMKKPQAFSVRK